jgi:hypothetical protein
MIDALIKRVSVTYNVMKCTRIGKKRCICSCFEVDQEMDAILLIISIVYRVCYNYITSVFHWNVTIWLVMKWSHDYKSDVSYPNETQIRTCTCLHDDVRCLRIECILLKFHWGMKALTEVHFQWSAVAVALHVENVVQSTLSCPNETSKECIQFL